MNDPRHRSKTEVIKLDLHSIVSGSDKEIKSGPDHEFVSKVFYFAVW